MLVVYCVIYWYPTCSRCLPLSPFEFSEYLSDKRSDIILDGERLRECVSCFVSNLGSLKKKIAYRFYDQDYNAILPRDG